MLALHLNELELDKIIDKTVYPVMPPKTKYRLSEFRKHLFP
ncbi:winged helix-turn-helix transcriptional regulator [Candidatus Enterococcus lowellii]